MQIFIVEILERLGNTQLHTQRYFSTLDKAKEYANWLIAREGFGSLSNISEEEGRIHLYSFKPLVSSGYESVAITNGEVE